MAGAGSPLLGDLGLPAHVAHPLATNAISSARVKNDLRLIDELTKEIHQLDRELVAFFKADPRMPRLRAIHGIGFFTAAVIIAEVWDVDRFRRPDQLCSWAGLTPKERSSAGHIRRSHITKQGSRVLRWALVEAATVAPRDPGHRRYFMQVLHNERRRTKIARLALARRLLTLCYYALRDEGGCRAYPVGQRTRRLPVTGALGAVLASTDGRVI